MLVARFRYDTYWEDPQSADTLYTILTTYADDDQENPENAGQVESLAEHDDPQDGHIPQTIQSGDPHTLVKPNRTLPVSNQNSHTRKRP